MSELNKDALVEELESIAQIYSRKVKYEYEVFPQIENERTKKTEAIRQSMLERYLSEKSSADETLKQKEPCLPKFACLEAPPLPSNTAGDKTRLLLTAFVGVLTLALLIPGLIMTLFNIGPGIYLSLLAIPGIIIWLCTFFHLDPFLNYTDALKSWQKENAEVLSGASAETDRAAFLQQCAVYENALSESVKQFAAQMAEVAAQADADTEVVNQKAREDTERSKVEYDKVCEQLNSVTLIHSDLVPQAHRMARLIRTGRADTVKEAANLAMEEVAQERQEQARQEEAARREEILRQQAYEEAQHNRAIERAVAEQNRIAERQLAEQEKANQIAERERRDADRARRDAQEAARRESSNAQRKYLDARNRYNSASAHYRACVARGATQDALRFQAEMERAKVEMINSGWSD